MAGPRTRRRKRTSLVPESHHDCPASKKRRKCSSFVYTPLDHSRASIRLLEVLPRQHEGEEIQCNIRHVVLNDNPKFNALSYEWGRPDGPRYTIKVNGRILQIRENLYSFLSHALLSTEVDGLSSLWIDAICIDQDNHQEKNHQVNQMKSIYQQASKVLAWIGPSTCYVDRIFDLLNADKSLKVFKDALEPAYSFWDIPAGWRYAVEDVAYRSYWTRLWIVQEILLPCTVAIVCGRRSISVYIWDALWQDMNNVYMEYDKWTLSDSPCQLILEHCRSRFPTRFTSPPYPEDHLPFTIMSLVKAFSTLFASQTCDKIYALLGLAIDSVKIRTNYGARIESVVLDLLLTCENFEDEDLGNCLAMFSIERASMLQVLDTGPHVPRDFVSNTRVSHNHGHEVSTRELLLPQTVSAQHDDLWELMHYKAFHKPLVDIGLVLGYGMSRNVSGSPKNWARKRLVLCQCNHCRPTHVALATKLFDHWQGMETFNFSSHDNNWSSSGFYMLFHQRKYVATAAACNDTIMIISDPALCVEQAEYGEGCRKWHGGGVKISLWHMLHVWRIADLRLADEQMPTIPLRCEEGNPVTVIDLMDPTTYQCVAPIA